ncbi:ABC transporter transmembrane domain-containing protein [Tabrizicola aquatica]|uniref:ABC transporter transmembrane domain-containing protein n=1 Tax=Tabrizicola aquatica TaxID=909926 RepID=UPI000CD32021|nr:ABC transporter ATP-binding protein [Tabrizicola aquatica]
MTVPPLFAKGRRAVWGGLAALALVQALALVAGVAGTRLAFAGLEDGAVPGLALGLIGGAALALAGLRPGLRLLAERLGQDQTIAIREALYRHAMEASPERLAGRRRGYLMLRLTGDMTTLKDGISRSLPQVLQAVTLVPAGVLALLMIDLRFGVAGAALTGLTLASLALTQGALTRAHKDLRRTRAKLVADMAERLPIAPDLARLGRRQAEVSRLATAGRALHRKSAARLIRAEGLRALPGGLAGLCGVAVLWDGAHRGLPAGEIAAALAALGVIGHALVELAGAIDRLAGWRIARGTLSRHLADHGGPDRTPRPDPVRLEQASGQLTVIAAPGLTTPTQLDLAPGTQGAISGPDIDRLMRLLSGQDRDPDVVVMLDGIALDALTPGSIRRNIGVLSAAPVLLKGSVRRNICLGLTDRPADERLLKRLARAGLGPALARLGGLDGPIPENGRTLSSADRLRLSALRAAVQRPKVLLLDAGGLPLPEDMQAYIAQSLQTVVTVAAKPANPDAG